MMIDPLLLTNQFLLNYTVCTIPVRLGDKNILAGFWRIHSVESSAVGLSLVLDPVLDLVNWLTI